MYSRIIVSVLLIFDFSVSSYAEVQLPKVLEVVPAILPADISDGIEWSDGTKTQRGNSGAVPAILPADISDGIEWSDDIYDNIDDLNDSTEDKDFNKLLGQRLDSQLQYYEYGPVLSASSGEYYDGLDELNYYDIDDLPDGFFDDILAMKKDDFYDSLDSLKKSEDAGDLNQPLNDGKTPVGDLADFYDQLYDILDQNTNDDLTDSDSFAKKDQTIPEKDLTKAKPANQEDRLWDDVVYPEITGGEDEVEEFDDQDQLQYSDNSAESDESSEEDGKDTSEESPLDDIKLLYEDLFGSKDNVRYQNIGRDMRFLELACYIGIFLGFILFTFGLFICCVRILRFRSQPPVDREVLTPEHQVKNVKLSGIIKSYARIPVEIRNMKPSNVAYKELYNVV